MAGLFELQLPNESRRRRSNDISEPRLSTSRARSNSPTPEATAKEIVSQLVAKQQAASTTAPSASSTSSIFPWKRRATGGPTDPSRQSSDSFSRNSADSSTRSISQSPDRKRLYNDGLSLRHTPHGTSVTAPTSPRASSSIDVTLTPSSPDPVSALDTQKEPVSPPRAASALAQAGLGLGLPPIAFPGPSSPISRHVSGKRKTLNRPGSAHGHESVSASVASLKVATVRRAKSFSRDQEVQDVSQHSRPLGKASDQRGDVLVFSRDRTLSAAPHSYSMPERSSGDVVFQKGKGKERASDIAGTTIPEKAGATRGRQAVSPPSLITRDRDRSATRFTSWWPGRRRIDSSPVNVQPSRPSPPPIPMRSQERPNSATAVSTPSLPSFRPFSPLMGDFRLSDSPKSTDATFGDRGEPTSLGLDDVVSTLGHGESAAVRRRHSLNNRVGRASTNIMPTTNQASSRPSSQIYSHSHKHSQSVITSDQLNPASHILPISALPPPSPIDGPSRQRPHSSGDSTTTSNRRRSMTVNSSSIFPLQSLIRETPLLLRQPVNRPSSSTGSSDPFLSGWGTNTGTPVSLEVPPEATALAAGPSDVQRTPSTSSGSTSSLSHSASTTRPARQRAGTTPPTSRTLTASTTSSSLPPPASSNRLLRRLSSTFFNTSSGAVTSSVDPPGLNSSGNLSGMSHSGAGTSSPATSNTSSPDLSKENLAAADGSRISVEALKQKPAKTPTRMPDETPEAYLTRLLDVISKAEVASILASSGDEFHNQTLRLYIARFKFLDDPLDVALRKLLMDLGLPRETQQIDRVMEAFAARYVRCNSRLFVNNDHPYILAFSLIMLHTDAFNKSNKNKMTKADYVKNAKLPGVPPEILECFFDNIVFAPFIFIEDPMDVNAPKGHPQEGTPRLNSISGSLVSSSGLVGSSGGSTILGKANKIDPYYLITQNLLGPLRADVNLHIPPINPLLYEGTDWPWDMQRLHRLFALSQTIQVQVDAAPSPATHNGNGSTISTPTRRKSMALPSLTVGYGPFMGSPPFSSEGLPSPPRMPALAIPQVQGARTLRIAKAGVMSRKEDSTEGGKKSTNRKWREWSVVLTGSQLLFFRDLNFVSHILGPPPAPELGLLYPDELISLSECIAIYDKTYKKYAYTFRFFMPNGRQFIFQASDENNLNEWISAINYASVFKSAGVQMRGLGMSHEDVEMTGMAAAESHLHDLRVSAKASIPAIIHTYGISDTTGHTEPLLSRPQSSGSSPKLGSGSKLLRSLNGIPPQVDLEVSGPHQLEGAQQFKATFDEVKAELAAHGTEQLQPVHLGRARTLSMGARSNTKRPSRPSTAGSGAKSDDMQHSSAPPSSSRSDIIRSYAEPLDNQITYVQNELDEALRIARNLAILTPFQRATRDRLQVAIGPLAKRVRAMRVHLAKLTCYRFVLLTDLAEEERQWEEAKREALRAATQRLGVADGLSHQESESQVQPSHLRTEPSTAESFYSALDAFEGDQAGNVSTPLSMLSEDDTSDFPFLPRTSSSAPPDKNATSTRSPGARTLSDLGPSSSTDGHERYYTAAETPEEIAEEWNETRAAKRVSLVRLPSDVKLSILNRQGRHPDEAGRHGQRSETAATSLDRTSMASGR